MFIRLEKTPKKQILGSRNSPMERPLQPFVSVPKGTSIIRRKERATKRRVQRIILNRLRIVSKNRSDQDKQRPTLLSNI